MRQRASAAGAPFTASVAIESIAAGGDGVARHEGLVVFVPRTAPGDVARVRGEVKEGARFARARLLDVERASPLRTEPPCAHYVADRCGGCQLQHLAYEAQLDAKAAIIRDGLQRIGQQALAAAPPVRASTRPWRYRRKLTLAMRRRGPGWIAGLHPYDAPGAVFDLADCPITDERVLATWAQVRAAAALLPEVPRLRGAVRLLDDGASFVLEGATRWPRARDFFAAVPSVRALWWVPEGGTRRLVADRRMAAEPGASFVQVNPETADALAMHVLARVRSHVPASVIDAFAGAGDVALALAREGVRVTAIELDPEASAWSASRLPAGSRALTGRVEALLPDALPADVVLLNPPRAGVDARVTAALAGATPRPRAIIYVSCNPATLARDVARLPGWRIASVAGFDMFPQTAHVETVCELLPEGA